MNWFYSDNGQQKGPVSDMEFSAMVRDGRIKPESLVWREGLPDWQPVSLARPDLLASPETPRIQGVAVSERNKDAVVQRMREGEMQPTSAGLGTDLRYAGFWIRVGAKLIDGILLSIVNGVIAMFFFGSIFSIMMDPAAVQRLEQDPQALMALMAPFAAFAAVSFLMQIAYNALLTGMWGGTLGKLAVGIKVVVADGSPISMGRAIGRALADLLNAFCALTYLLPAFDEPQKRGLHDHICGTRVIYK